MEVSLANAPFTFDGQKCSRPRRGCLPARFNRIATWNVEGLRGASSVKLEEIREFMRLRRVGILCLQETHLTGAEYYEDGGFMFFVSGATSGEARTFAGVGFFVAPWAAGSIVSFKAVSERVASLRVKVTGGILTILNVYVPHDRHALDERHAVFADLSKEMKVKRQHCSTIVAGDFNAQLGSVHPGEENFIGAFVYNKELKPKNSVTNRDLLLEFCTTHGTILANTIFDYPDEFKVTYYGLCTNASDPICVTRFSQIDHVLCHGEDSALIQDCWASRSDPLQSHHFPTTFVINAVLEKQKKPMAKHANIQALQGGSVRATFGSDFTTAIRSSSQKETLDDHAEAVVEAFRVAGGALPKQVAVAKRPWISKRTLGLIDERRAARLSPTMPQSKM